jgi:hypothetical protein
MQLYRYFVSQSNEFCHHNPLCCFSTSVYCCCLFRYRLSPETFGYTHVSLGKEFYKHVNVCVCARARAIEYCFLSDAIIRFVCRRCALHLKMLSLNSNGIPLTAHRGRLVVRYKCKLFVMISDMSCVYCQ